MVFLPVLFQRNFLFLCCLPQFKWKTTTRSKRGKKISIPFPYHSLAYPTNFFYVEDSSPKTSNTNYLKQTIVKKLMKNNNFIKLLGAVTLPSSNEYFWWPTI